MAGRRLGSAKPVRGQSVVSGGPTPTANGPVTRRGTLLAVDATMLVLFTTLMSWRLTGVTIHEWFGITLTLLIVGHLLVHWGWVEGRVSAVRRATQRRLGGLLLNTAVFLTMGAAIVSGFVVSKVVIPNHLTPDDYLRWHGFHESASTLTVFLLGLHVAYNWDRIRASFRRQPGRSLFQGMSAGLLLRRLAWVAVLSVALSGAVWSASRLLPAHQRVMFVYADGRRELAAPPAEITRIRPGTDVPSPGIGMPKAVLSLLVLFVVALIGRQLMSVRRVVRRRARARQAPTRVRA